MNPIQFLPSYSLRNYVQGYWIFKTQGRGLNQTLYPSGHVELAINISQGVITTILNDRHLKMPDVEVLGQLTKPACVIAAENTTLLIARFFPFATSLFLPNPVSDFTNDSIDGYDIFTLDSRKLYIKLLRADTIAQKVLELDEFLIEQFHKNVKRIRDVKLIEPIYNRICAEHDSFDIGKLSRHYNLSKRYIQKLFLQGVGITPHSLFAINRFNRIFEVIKTSSSPLTSIAYEGGYYDQAHFIKDFKRYSGVSPSEARATYATKVIGQ
jgi:AraC-like DNA-binding protein